MYSKNFKKGFSLVEVLVIISIMGLLVAIFVSTYYSYVEKAKYTRATSDLKVINLAFERYLEDNDDLPPIGTDHCDACKISVYLMDYSQDNTESWQQIVDIFNNTNYPFKLPKIDPWGTPYAYDKNYSQPCPAWTIICSAGPNKLVDTWLCQADNPVVEGDDICIWIPGPFGYW